MPTFKINKVFKNGKVSKLHDLVEANSEAEAKEIYIAKHAKKYKASGLQISEINPASETVSAVDYSDKTVISIPLYSNSTGDVEADIETLQNKINTDIHESCSSSI
jgi:hypothetical protein